MMRYPFLALAFIASPAAAKCLTGQYQQHGNCMPDLRLAKAAAASAAAPLQAPRVTTVAESGKSNGTALGRTDLHQLQVMDAYNFKALAPYRDVRIRDVKFDAARAVVYNAYQSSWPKERPADAGAIYGLTVERVQAKYSKYCIKITRPSRDIVIRDFAFTGGEKRTDNAIAVGISFGSTASNILVENGKVSGLHSLAQARPTSRATGSVRSAATST